MNKSRYRCFAYELKHGKEICTILTVTPSSEVCGGCKFYKTREKFDADRDKSFESLIKKGVISAISDRPYVNREENM